MSCRKIQRGFAGEMGLRAAGHARWPSPARDAALMSLIACRNPIDRGPSVAGQDVHPRSLASPGAGQHAPMQPQGQEVLSPGRDDDRNRSPSENIIRSYDIIDADVPTKYRSNHRPNPRNMPETRCNQNPLGLPVKPEFQIGYTLSESADRQGAFGNGSGQIYNLHNDAKRREGLGGIRSDRRDGGGAAGLRPDGSRAWGHGKMRLWGGASSAGFSRG